MEYISVLCELLICFVFRKTQCNHAPPPPNNNNNNNTGQLLNVQYFLLKCIFLNFSWAFIKESSCCDVSVCPGSNRIFCFHVFNVSDIASSHSAFGECARERGCVYFCVCVCEGETATETKVPREFAALVLGLVGE